MNIIHHCYNNIYITWNSQIAKLTAETTKKELQKDNDN